MDQKRLVKISKYLSKHLRHNPERISVSVDSSGWVLVNDLLLACKKGNFNISKEELKCVVEQNDKKRFSFSKDGLHVRANQGHSIKVNLGYEPVEPPDFLYHGTAKRNISSVSKLGIIKMNRHHVHLSPDYKNALKVGKRHGNPVVYLIKANKMFQDGHKFYMSDNEVWLTAHVPNCYFELVRNLKPLPRKRKEV